MTATTTAAALLSALRKGSDFAVTVNALCDLLEEGGHATSRDLRHYRSVRRRERWLCESMEERCVKAGLVTWAECPCHLEGVALHRRLEELPGANVPVVCRERSPKGGRKELAAMARRLFAYLGLKGVSVTTPNHSMASGVDVSLPKRLDVARRSDDPDWWRDDPAGKANRRAEGLVGAILILAFPATGDRSDLQSDYHDRVWTID